MRALAALMRSKRQFRLAIAASRLILSKTSAIGAVSRRTTRGMPRVNGVLASASWSWESPRVYVDSPR